MVIIFLFIISISSYGFEIYYQSSYLETEDLLNKHSVSPSLEVSSSALISNLSEKILSDEQSLINPIFKIEDYYRDSVRFWFSIYTQYSSNQIVVHDKNNLALTYAAVDFTPIFENTKLNRFAKAHLQAKFSSQAAKKIKLALKNLEIKRRIIGETEQNILNLITKNNIKIPANSNARRAFFRKLNASVRVQTGQRDMIFQGIIRSLPYWNFFIKQFENFQIPIELRAIPFLESSFNLKAESRVGASGIWQIMPFIAQKIMIYNKEIDTRKSPIIATITALHLLKQNYQILKSWDLAITAYNSGTKHLLRAKKKIKKIKNTKFNLENVLKNYRHPHLGFASKNFYSEFLALVYTLAYKDLIFPTEGVSLKNETFAVKDDVRVFISLCKNSIESLYKELGNYSPYLKEMNKHLPEEKKYLNRFDPFVSTIMLNSKKYFHVTDQNIRKRFPKDWAVLAKNYNCSTK